MKTNHLLSAIICIAAFTGCKNDRGDDTHMDTTTISTLPAAPDKTKTAATDSVAPKKDSAVVATNSATIAAKAPTVSSTPAGKETTTKPATTGTKQPSLDDRYRKTSRKGRIILAALKANAADKITQDNEGVYNRAEIMPVYPGGEEALRKYIEHSVEYPDQAMNNNVEGTVKVSFAVDEKGRVANAKVISAPLGAGLEDEALRIVKQMPKWTPGQVGGHNVKTRLMLPITYKIE